MLLVFGCLLLACDKENDTKQSLKATNQIQISESAININNASAEELAKLPNIGDKTAQEIIKHREKFGRFRKPEHLLLVHGISDKLFRQIKSRVKAE